MKDHRERKAARSGTRRETPGDLQRAFSLPADEGPWSWLDETTPDPTATETRFEGVEGWSDTLLRARRDESRR